MRSCAQKGQATDLHWNTFKQTWSPSETGGRRSTGLTRSLQWRRWESDAQWLFLTSPWTARAQLRKASRMAMPEQSASKRLLRSLHVRLEKNDRPAFLAEMAVAHQYERVCDAQTSFLEQGRCNEERARLGRRWGWLAVRLRLNSRRLQEWEKYKSSHCLMCWYRSQNI